MADENVKIVINGQSVELSKEVLTQGIEKGEVEIKSDNLILYTKEEAEQREKKIESTGYNKGKTDGVEIEWKEVKRSLGIEVEGKKREEILNAFKEKVLTDAKIEPQKKVQELESTVSQLRSNLTKAEQEKEEIKVSFGNKEKEYKTTSIIINSIPDDAAGTLTKQDIASLFKSNGYVTDIVEGKEVVMLNGEILKHEKTLSELSIKDVVAKFVADKGFIKSADGRGKKDEPGSKVKAGSLESFNEEMTDKGIKLQSPEYIAEMGDRIKNKTLTL